MGSSLSNIIHNLSEAVYKTECKQGNIDKEYEICRMKKKDCECFLEYSKFKDKFIECKNSYFNKNYHNKIESNIKKKKFLI